MPVTSCVYDFAVTLALPEFSALYVPSHSTTVIFCSVAALMSAFPSQEVQFLRFCPYSTVTASAATLYLYTLLEFSLAGFTVIFVSPVAVPAADVTVRVPSVGVSSMVITAIASMYSAKE